MEAVGQQLKEAEFHDEMNLLEFLRTLWQQKRLILLTTALSLAVGVAYILFTSPIYEATGYLRPPTVADLVQINKGRPAEKEELPLYSPKDVYEIFSKVLQSEATKRHFFNTVFLSALQDKDLTYSETKLYTIFSKALSIKEIRLMPVINPAIPPDYVVAYRGGSPEQDAEFVRKYIALAKQKATDELFSDLSRQQRAMIHQLRTRIDSIREVANTERLDRIEQLKEAIKVAQAVGIKGETVSPFSGVIADASVVNNPGMMYLRGSAALGAELDNLSNRKSSDAFVPKTLKLRETQSMLDFYKKIAFNKDKITLFRLDSEIRVPDLRLAPRKKITLILSVFAGLFLGITIALTRKSLAFILK